MECFSDDNKAIIYWLSISSVELLNTILLNVPQTFNNHTCKKKKWTLSIIKLNEIATLPDRVRKTGKKRYDIYVRCGAKRRIPNKLGF